MERNEVPSVQTEGASRRKLRQLTNNSEHGFSDRRTLFEVLGPSKAGYMGVQKARLARLNSGVTKGY